MPQQTNEAFVYLVDPLLSKGFVPSQGASNLPLYANLLHVRATGISKARLCGGDDIDGGSHFSVSAVLCGWLGSRARKGLAQSQSADAPDDKVLLSGGIWVRNR